MLAAVAAWLAHRVALIASARYATRALSQVDRAVEIANHFDPPVDLAVARSYLGRATRAIREHAHWVSLPQAAWCAIACGLYLLFAAPAIRDAISVHAAAYRVLYVWTTPIALLIAAIAIAAARLKIRHSLSALSIETLLERAAWNADRAHLNVCCDPCDEAMPDLMEAIMLLDGLRHSPPRVDSPFGAASSDAAPSAASAPNP